MNLENKTLREKVDKLNGKKILLKSKYDNVSKDLNFKEYEIKKLEEVNNNLLKELNDLKFSKMKEFEFQESQKSEEVTPKNENPNNLNKEKNYMDNVYIQYELNKINEEKNNLLSENKLLLEEITSLKNEIKFKLINKLDYEQKYSIVESERNIYFNKFKNFEVLCEKLQRELNLARTGKEDLKCELEKSQQKFRELIEKSSPDYNKKLNRYNTETPLNLLMDEDLFEDNRSNRKTIANFNKGFVNIDQNLNKQSLGEVILT